MLAIIVLAAAVFSVRAQSCTGGFKASPDCTKYYQCNNGQWELQACPSGLNWNAKGTYCDWPASSGCTAGAAPASAPAPPVSAPAPIPAPVPAPVPAPGGLALISQAEFNAAAATKGGKPDVSYYNGFIASLPKALITNKAEAAKFLAHAVWETVGFIYMKEVYCQTNMAACQVAYPANSGGRQDVVYYGRGCLQLTWDYNYKACSQYLYGDDRLIQNPDTVANDPTVSWASAAWFWYANVHANAATFGGTLKAINGALECDGGSHAENRELRFNHYKEILKILSMPVPADNDGYCHA